MTSNLSEIFEDYNNSIDEMCPLFTSHSFERVDTQFISQRVVEQDFACLCGFHKYVYQYLVEDLE